MTLKTNEEINECLKLIVDMLEQMPEEYILKTYYSILLDFNHTHG